jgi:UDP-glucuronate decarboxylase
VRELAEIVIEMTGSGSEIVHYPLPADDPQLRRPDISFAREALDWEPKIALREGLEKTIGYFRERLKQAAA